MSTPAPNPPHQDLEVPHPRVSLATVLALLRLLAGRRGHAGVTWWAGGFRYVVQVRREDRTGYSVDADPGAWGRRGALMRLRDHLLNRAPDDAG